MNPIKIPGANHTFGAPPDWNAKKMGQDCAALEVLATEDDEGLVMLQSAWKPSPEEVYALTHGGAVVLTIYGKSHPVVSVGVTSQEVG